MFEQLYSSINGDNVNFFQWSWHDIPIFKKTFFCYMMVKQFLKAIWKATHWTKLATCVPQIIFENCSFQSFREPKLLLQSQSGGYHYQNICVCCADHWRNCWRIRHVQSTCYAQTVWISWLLQICFRIKKKLFCFSIGNCTDPGLIAGICSAALFFLLCWWEKLA